MDLERFWTLEAIWAAGGRAELGEQCEPAATMAARFRHGRRNRRLEGGSGGRHGWRHPRK